MGVGTSSSDAWTVIQKTMFLASYRRFTPSLEMQKVEGPLPALEVVVANRFTLENYGGNG
jgi:hypothetical protein